MDFINTLLPTIETWFERFITVQNGVQLLTVVVCGALAFFTAKKWRIITNKLLSEDKKHTVIQFVLRASNRIAFPVSMLLYLISTSFVIEQLGVDAKVLDVFTPLLLSMAAITFNIYVLRKGFRPSPALRAWENFISLFIWGLVALHLIGWLPDVIKGLDNLAINFGNSRFSMLSLLQLFIAIIFFAVLANWLTRLIALFATPKIYRYVQHTLPPNQVDITARYSPNLPCRKDSPLYIVIFSDSPQQVNSATFSPSVNKGCGENLIRLLPSTYS